MNDIGSPEPSSNRGREPVEESPNHGRPTASAGGSPTVQQEGEESEGKQAKPVKASQAKTTHSGTAEAESPATPDKVSVPMAVLKAEAVGESDEASGKVGRETPQAAATGETTPVGSKAVERSAVHGSVKASGDKQEGGKALPKAVVVVSDQAAGKAAGAKVQPSGKVAGGGMQPTLIVPNETQLMASRNVSSQLFRDACLTGFRENPKSRAEFLFTLPNAPTL